MHALPRLVLTLVAGSIRTVFVLASSNIVELDESNLDRWVGNGKSALVEFWAPWCDHCMQLEPVYEELGDTFAHAKKKLTIAKVNSENEKAKPLIEKFGVTGLPTIKWFGADGETEDYDPEGSRSLEDLVDFVTKKSGLKAKLPKPPSPPETLMTQLTPDNFDRIVNDPTKDVLVAFTATWCPHCEKMKPIYKLLASRFQPEKHIVIANFDGDADVGHALAKKYGVEGYPILKLFPKGSKEKRPIDYKLPRDETNMVEFLNKYTGTQRAVGGGLNDKAGRSEALDEIAGDFVRANPVQRKAMYKRAKPVATAAGKTGKHYLRIMDKLMDGSDTFLEKEKTRLLALLKKHASAGDKLDDFKIKYNILSTFIINSAAQKVADGIRIERDDDEFASRVEEPEGKESKRVKEEL